MLCLSQETSTETESLFRCFSPSRFERDLFVILTGYIDDSGDAREIFTLSCLLAEGTTWTSMEADWKAMLDAKNDELRCAGRREISRYHAADCSSRLDEFEGWSVDEQKEFTQNMLGIFRRQPMLNTISFSLNLRELVEELPWSAHDPLEWGHKLCLEFMMLELGNQIAGADPQTSIKVVLIHDWSRYNGTMLHSFERLMADPDFLHKRFFSTIAPMHWEGCIPLQAADLMAYENYKDVERLSAKRNRRFTLREMLEMGCFSGRSRRLDRGNLKGLAKAYKDINPQW